MNLAADLLEQADHLARRDTTRPRQASLRRAVSSAYYAIFHLLIREACVRFVPGDELRHLTARAFNHADMKKACSTVLKEPVPPPLGPLLGLGKPALADLRVVAGAFVNLQQIRHAADYNPARRFDRLETLRFVREAGDAFAAWDRVKAEPGVGAFLLSLLLGERWNR